MISFDLLWKAHPGRGSHPCPYLLDSCAARMGVALRAVSFSFEGYPGLVCYRNWKHTPRHLQRAQELADWLSTKPDDVGNAIVLPADTGPDHPSLKNKKGILFFQDGFLSSDGKVKNIDHIDVWDGSQKEEPLKGGDLSYFKAPSKRFLFWKLKD